MMTTAGTNAPPPGALVLLLALPALGCAGDGGSGAAAASAVVDTVDGVERVSYPADHGATLGWSADTLFVLGDAFAEEAYQFNQVSAEGLASDGDGNLLILDRQGQRVLRYGPGGEHLGTYGRGGEGPGELNLPMGVDIGPGDSIWVSDFENSRLTGYPVAGGEPRSIPFPENPGFPSPRLAALEDGIVMQFRPMFNFGRGSGGEVEMSRGDGDDPEPLLPVVRYDRGDFSPQDTLWTTPEPPTDMVQLEMGNNLIVTMMAREFYPELRWDAFSDGGLVVSDTAAYLLRFLSPDGQLERQVHRDPPPRRVTEADREAARERVREAAASGGGIRIGGSGPDEDTQQRMLEQRLEKMTFAELVPRIVDLRVDPLDRVWVGVSEDEADQLARIDIYDRGGDLVGQLRDFPMPDVFLGADRVGILRRDDLDVQQVVVVQVREAGAR